MAKPSPKAVAIALAIAAALFATRAPTLHHGVEYHPDEGQVVFAAFNILKGQWLPEPMRYPMGASLLHAPAQAIAELRSFSSKGAGQTQEEIRRAGRRTAMAMFAATVALCCFMAWRLSPGPLAPALCGFMMAFGMFFIEQSRYATVDTAAALLTALNAALCCQAAATPRRGHLYGLAAFFAGAAAGTKYNAVFFALAPIAAAMTFGRARVYLAALCAASFAAGMALFNPIMLLDTGKFFANAAFEARHYGFESHPGYAGTFPGNFAHAALFIAFFSVGAGTLLFAAAAPGAFAAAAPSRTRSMHFILLATAAISTLFLCAQKCVFLRNYYPSVTILAPLAAGGVARCLRGAGRGRVALAAIAVAGLAIMAVRGTALCVILAGEDTRRLAEERIKTLHRFDGKTILQIGFLQPRLAKSEAVGVWDLDPLNYRMNPGDILMLSDANYLPYLRESASNPVFGGLYAGIQKGFREFQAAHARWINQRWRSPTDHWIFGSRIRGSTLGQYESPNLTLYYYPEAAAPPE